MPELHLPEDEALLYLLGELTPAERSAFEARLKQSAALRATVRELEEGAVALSMASPRRRPPQEIWRQIQKTVSRQTRWRLHLPALWTGWRRHGWAAAAACLVAWFLYALWVNRPSQSGAPLTSQISEVPPVRSPTVASSQGKKTEQLPPVNTPSNASVQLLQARTQEIASLRWQMTELNNRLTQLSQALAQQEALLSEPGRFKFFQLVSHSGGRSSETTAPVSPDLQRTLLVAMARELGWSGAPPEASNRKEARENASPAGRTNYAGVDFVDLRAGSNSLAVASLEPHVELEPATTTTEAASLTEPATPTPPAGSTEPAGAIDPSSLASASTNPVPGFITGTNAVLAFDSSVVPAGSLLTFWRTSWNGQYQSLGGAVLGNAPMAVLVPYSYSAASGGNLTVTAGMPNGTSNVLGHFSTLGTGPP